MPARTDAPPPPVPSRLARLRLRLGEQVPAHALAAFRILFGALLFIDFWRFILHDRVWRYWIQPDLHFSYPGFGWIPAPTEPWVQLAWIGVGLSALLVTLGLFYRLAIVALTILFAWFFLIDAAEYLNHFYLVILYALLMCFLPCAQVWSLDAWLRGRSNPQTVPRGAVSLLRAQTEIMLIFAGLVKITPDWLAGEPLGLWMRQRVDGTWLEAVMAQDGVILLACWSVIALHVLGAPLLLWRKTRLATFLVYCVFHIGNAWSFNIGIFPWLTIAASTIFFAPDWPLRLMRRAPPLPMPAPRRALPNLALIAMALWIAVQIALPLRGMAFASEVRWSGEGHRFSWRMRIFDRQAEGRFTLTERSTGEVWLVDPDDHLTTRQTDKMLVRADLVHQFALHLARLWASEGHDVEVRASICKSLNGRPCQDFIDPSVDLTRVSVNPLGSDAWIVPLQIPVWGVADNAPDRGVPAPALPDRQIPVAEDLARPAAAFAASGTSRP